MSRNVKAILIAVLVVIWSAVLSGGIRAQTVTPIPAPKAVSAPLMPMPKNLAVPPKTLASPYIDYRYTGEVPREANGDIKRDPKVTREFRKLYACPSTGKFTGACPGWAMDHPLPIDCGFADAVWNLQWLPDEIKSAKGPFSKDHFERRIYGGRGMSEGCP
jgi:hypothetical protein